MTRPVAVPRSTFLVSKGGTVMLLVISGLISASIAGVAVASAAATDAGGLVATVIVVTGLVVLVALFERRRARHIEHDLHDMAIERHVEPIHLHRRPAARVLRARRRGR